MPVSLNPADIVVNDSLPAYPMQILPSSSITDEQVAAGNPLRIAARQKVLGHYDAMIAEERSVKEEIQSTWNSLNDDQRLLKQKVLDSYNKEKNYLDLLNFVKKELVWWNNNLELSPRMVAKRDIEYDETLLKKQISLERYLIGVAAAEEVRVKEVEETEEQKREKLRNRTTYDDITDTFSSLGSILFRLLYIIVGLRCASFAANEYLYKPVPYRILIFIYVFIFVPFFGPYYLWKGIEHRIWNTPLPPYEGFFPIYAYEPSDPLTFNRRLTGYRNTSQLQEWITKKLADELAARDAAITTGLKAKIIAEHSGP